MTQIANTVYNLAEEKWGWVLEAIDDKISEESNFEEHAIYATDEETEEGEEEKKPAHLLQKIYGYLLNIIGAPCIIFTCHHKVGQTRIRGKRPCRSVLGFDATLYILRLSVNQYLSVTSYGGELSTIFSPKYVRNTCLPITGWTG